MKVTIVGAGTAVPYRGMSQSCVLVEKGKNKVLVDAGIGSYLRLSQMGIEFEDVKAILLTHNHLDHNGDVLAILKAKWLGGKGETIIIGPNGTKSNFESLFEAYPYLRRKLSFRVNEISGECNLFGFKISAIKTNHSIESCAYLIDGKVLISGDTSPMEEIFRKECEILIHELSLPFGYDSKDHTTPEKLKDLIRLSKAGKIVFTHIYPQTWEEIDRIERYLADERVHFAVDGDSFDLNGCESN
jgi:ribonuclease BN (tRNA processing enzyme)